MALFLAVKGISLRELEGVVSNCGAGITVVTDILRMQPQHASTPLLLKPLESGWLDEWDEPARVVHNIEGNRGEISDTKHVWGFRPSLLDSTLVITIRYNRQAGFIKW